MASESLPQTVPSAEVVLLRKMLGKVAELWRHSEQARWGPISPPDLYEDAMALFRGDAETLERLLAEAAS